MRHLGYDSETQVYTYEDGDGSMWEIPPRQWYDRLTQVSGLRLPSQRPMGASQPQMLIRNYQDQHPQSHRLSTFLNEQPIFRPPTNHTRSAWRELGQAIKQLFSSSKKKHETDKDRAYNNRGESRRLRDHDGSKEDAAYHRRERERARERAQYDDIQKAYYREMEWGYKERELEYYKERANQRRDLCLKESHLVIIAIVPLVADTGGIARA
ncbi:hypothetical protein VTI74DRAFT_7329 [Chaetomium olivicolor]